MNYGINLKSLRERVGLTNIKLGELLGISDSLYSRYEKEKQVIPIKHLITLSKFYKVSLDYLFSFTNIKNYNNLKYDINKNKLSKRLKELRIKNKLTQVEIANILHIDQPTWSIYEHAKSIIGTPFLYIICTKYKVSADYLLGRIDKKNYF